MKLKLLCLASAFLGSVLSQAPLIGTPVAAQSSRGWSIGQADNTLRTNHVQMADANIISVETQELGGTNYRIVYQKGPHYFEGIVNPQFNEVLFRQIAYTVPQSQVQQPKQNLQNSPQPQMSQVSIQKPVLVSSPRPRPQNQQVVSPQFSQIAQPQPQFSQILPISQFQPQPLLQPFPKPQSKPQPQLQPQVQSQQTALPSTPIDDPSLVDQAELNPLCKIWSSSTVCKQCSYRTYFQPGTNTCVPVSDDCRTFNPDTGACKDCYNGFNLVDGKCLNLDVTVDIGGGKTTSVSGRIASNPLCTNWELNTCKQCAFRSYLNDKGMCVKVPDDCKQFDKATGQCLKCFGGLTLLNGSCLNLRVPTDIGDGRSVAMPVLIASNPFCDSWDGDTCKHCAFRSFFDQSGVCIKIDDNCVSFDSTSGTCLQCYKGFKLTSTGCVSIPLTPPQAPVAPAAPVPVPVAASIPAQTTDQRVASADASPVVVPPPQTAFPVASIQNYGQWTQAGSLRRQNVPAYQSSQIVGVPYVPEGVLPNY